MFQAICTVGYSVPDLNKAKAWYTEVLGFGPYFDEPFYVGFNVGGYELGLLPDDVVPAPKSVGVITYWGVPDANAALQRLVSLGAMVHNPVQDVGEGILVGAVIDPFGNVLGVIQNPHFKPKNPPAP